ncbi:MAG: hypothetical protein COB83_08090 [Gammaproteobacteria bacterium]|nr:MAG: hypothetical protein COB83_08090 [Gammaproteobacteria bacterium]
MSLDNKLQRVEIAGELLANANITKTKKAVKVLGDETLSLLCCLVRESNESKKELEILKLELSQMKKELNFIG